MVLCFLTVQLCGEAFGSTWQFSKAFTGRNTDKNVYFGQRFYEGQDKGKS